MNLKTKFSVLSFVIVLLVAINSFCFGAKKETQDLKVLVIEINPILESITNKELYPENDGHPKVSEYFGQDTNKAIDELKEDLEFASHGYLNIIMDYEYLNEFPTYISVIKGTELHSFTEEMYVESTRSESNPDKGTWYNVITNLIPNIPSYSFDYEYLIDKFDLIERKNNGEFDQVWINSIDPAQTYETMMVGKDAFWVNGTPLKKDCNNFIIANISISRRDANLHALAHGFEGIMSQVFNGTYFRYGKNYEDYTEEDFKNLNLWEQFSMTSKESNGDNSGIGNVHYPFNGTKDYDYTNDKQVYSYWKNWLNYPDLSGKKTLSDSSAWLDWSENKKLGEDENKDPDRLYMRLWFYLFPHVEGVTNDGYQNNWWKYYITLDYAKNVACKFDSKKYSNKNNLFNESIFKIEYASDLKKDVPYDETLAHIEIEDTSVIKIKGGKLSVLKDGETTISCFADGESAKYRVLTSIKDGIYTLVIADADKNIEIKIDEEDNSSVNGNDNNIEDTSSKNDKDEKEYENSKRSNKDNEKNDEVIVWKRASEWAEKELKDADELNLIPKSFENLDFTKEITRLQFVYVAVKLNEKFSHKIITPTINNPFIDIADNEVLKAYTLGITKGTSENEFSPDKLITREEMATMLTRALTPSGVDTSIDLTNVEKFKDDDQMSEWSRDSIYYMANKEAILGIDDAEKIFGVMQNATIEQAILISKRCVKNIEK